MTPGTYIRRRREAAGVAIDDIALRLETVPAVSAMTRAEWLSAIEADVAPVPVSLVNALVHIVRLDETVLDALALAHAGVAADVPRLCSKCACSEHDPCGAPGHECWWIADDQCSACVEVPAA